jgi:hypothetical protein
MTESKKVLMGFRLPGEPVGHIVAAIHKTGIDTTLSALLQVHVTNMGNQLKHAKTVEEKREILFSYLNYKLSA